MMTLNETAANDKPIVTASRHLLTAQDNANHAYEAVYHGYADLSQATASLDVAVQQEKDARIAYTKAFEEYKQLTASLEKARIALFEARIIAEGQYEV